MMLKNVFAAILLSTTTLAAGNVLPTKGGKEGRVLNSCNQCDDPNHPNPCQGDGPFQQYFTHCNRRTYIQCDEAKQCFEQKCPKGTRWNQDFTACVQKKCGGVCPNRCSAKKVEGGDLFRSHCSDETKYQQCDAFGGCFEMDCAPGTVWKNTENTCVVHENKD